jgi:hypothetical protein
LLEEITEKEGEDETPLFSSSCSSTSSSTNSQSSMSASVKVENVLLCNNEEDCAKGEG